MSSDWPFDPLLHLALEMFAPARELHLTGVEDAHRVTTGSGLFIEELAEVFNFDTIQPDRTRVFRLLVRYCKVCRMARLTLFLLVGLVRGGGPFKISLLLGLFAMICGLVILRQVDQEACRNIELGLRGFLAIGNVLVRAASSGHQCIEVNFRYRLLRLLTTPSASVRLTRSTLFYQALK